MAHEPEIDNLTETSSNLARVLVANGEISIESLQRSSIDSQKDDMANRCGVLWKQWMQM